MLQNCQLPSLFISLLLSVVVEVIWVLPTLLDPEASPGSHLSFFFLPAFVLPATVLPVLVLPILAVLSDLVLSDLVAVQDPA